MASKAGQKSKNDIKIIDLTPQNIADYGVCGYKDVRKHLELRRKIDWFNEYYPKGLRIKALFSETGGYQGMLELARRSGQTHPIEAHAVMQDDVFEYELGLESRLVHKPNMNIDREDYNRLTHVYAICRTKDPTAKPIFVVLTKAQVERRRRRGANGPAWRTDPVAMALKSSVRALFPWIPKSSEMALADMLDMRFEKGRTATATVASMLTDENVASLESTGVDLTADQDDEEPEEPEAEAAVDETPAKVQDAIAKAREHQAKNKPAATADPDADGR